MTTRPPPPPRYPTDLLYSEARSQLDRQLDDFNQTSVIIGIVFGLGGTEAGAVGAFLAIPHSAAVEGVIHALLWVFVISVGVLVCSGFVALTGRRALGPGLEDIAEAARQDMDVETIRLSVIEALSATRALNQRFLIRQARFLIVTLLAVVLETVVLIAAVVVVAGAGTPQGTGMDNPLPVVTATFQ
jgi:hypothetical protein